MYTELTHGSNLVNYKQIFLYQQGELNLTFTVWNNTNPPERITSLSYTSLSASHGNLSSTVVTKSAASEKLLYFAWQVKCADHFFGEDCSTHCVPTDGVSGHYNCSSNGTKNCLLGWKDPQSNCTTSKCIM